MVAAIVAGCLQAEYPVFSSEVVETAFCLAARAHNNQQRKNGDSLLSHCVQVAKTLASLGLDAEAVAAGLLHECLENNNAFRSQLEEFMPASVVSVCDRVNTISEMSRLYRQHNSSGSFSEETFKRMLVAMEDVTAVLVKLADRIHNMRTISVLPKERQEALARETLEVYSCVANRLGVWCIKAELEDLAFSVLHPEVRSRRLCKRRFSKHKVQPACGESQAAQRWASAFPHASKCAGIRPVLALTRYHFA